MNGEHLHITHVIRAKPPGELGGAELHVLDLAAVQLAQGHDVRVIFLGPAQISGWVRERGIPIHQSHSMRMVDWVLTLRSALRANPPDVLHTHGYRADLIALAMRFLVQGVARWTFVVTAHGFLRTSLGLRVLSRLNEAALRRADVVIAVSSAEAQRLTKLLRRPVRFVSNGIARPEPVPRLQALARLGCEPSRRVVAFVGRFSPEKRPDLFVDMADIVASRHPHTEFLLIGSGPLLSDVHERAAAAEAKVVVAGLLSNAASLMEAIDVLVCPSDTEGTPRVVIEAMMAGVPVVATCVGGVPDLITNEWTGVLVDPGSPGALAVGVARLLDDAIWSRAIGDRARTQALARFSVERMADLVAQAYRSQFATRAKPEMFRSGQPGTPEPDPSNGGGGSVAVDDADRWRS